MGQPGPERICTSIVERSNLSRRMGLRRFTRLTNAFSKRWENHWAAVACWFAFYKFCSLRWLPGSPITFGACENAWRLRNSDTLLADELPRGSRPSRPSGHARILLHMRVDGNAARRFWRICGLSWAGDGSAVFGYSACDARSET